MQSIRAIVKLSCQGILGGGISEVVATFLTYVYAHRIESLTHVIFEGQIE